MPALNTYLAFILAALVIVFTPGPGMIYYVSRSICQGSQAGLISLAGGITAVIIYMLGACFGITALIFKVPYAYDFIRYAGAAYLLFLAWQALKPGGKSPFQVRQLPQDRPAVLYRMGVVTILLNPKVALFYLSILPQFIDPQRGNILAQSLILGFTHIALAILGNGLIILSAGKVAKFLAENPAWLLAQRWVMGLVLGGVAIRIVFVG